jgi:hypothetical protein
MLLSINTHFKITYNHTYLIPFKQITYLDITHMQSSSLHSFQFHQQLSLLSDIFPTNRHNTLLLRENISYIYFYGDEIKALHFNNYFLRIDDTTYYCDVFTNNHITQLVRNTNLQLAVANKQMKELYFPKAILFFVSTPSAGHELASILQTVYLYYKHELFDYDVVISDKLLSLGVFVESVLNLFFPANKIHMVDNCTIVHIQHTWVHFPPPHLTDESVDFLLETLLHSTPPSTIVFPKNVCMIKMNSSINMNSAHRAFDASYKRYFELNQFQVIAAETLGVIELYHIIQNCQSIVLSWGCNSFINRIFVRSTQDVIILGHVGYKGEYNQFILSNQTKTHWTPICKVLTMIPNLSSKLNPHKLNLFLCIHEIKKNRANNVLITYPEHTA